MWEQRLSETEWQKCKLVLIVSYVLLLNSCRHIKGVVEISPSEVAPVCQAGDQLELTCNTSEGVHRWEFTVFPENMTLMPTPISILGVSGIPQPLTIGTSTITFSRLSSQNILPLVSRVTVSPVSSGLNGTVVKCIEGISSTESVAITVIRIIDSQQFDLSVQSHSEVFSSNGVTVTLEWTLLNSQTYYQQLLRNVSVEADPPLSNVMFTGNMRAQLTLSYNTLYNVSVIQHSICQQLIRTKFLLLNYSKCSDPMELITTHVMAVGYEDPALEGQIIIFTCRPGQILNGSNSSTCMGNGEWEPDLGQLECIGGQGTTVTSPTTLAMCNNPLYVLHINGSMRGSLKLDARMCCSGFLIARTNTTTCLENGEWELETSKLKSEGNCNSDNTSLRPALISVSCLSVVASVLTFIIGYICGHCFSQRCRKLIQHKQSMPMSTAADGEIAEDLELKENVAYVTLRPK